MADVWLDVEKRGSKWVVTAQAAEGRGKVERSYSNKAQARAAAAQIAQRARDRGDTVRIGDPTDPNKGGK